MPELNYDKASMLAYRLKHGARITVDDVVGDHLIIMSVRTYQQVLKTRYPAPTSHPGRGGYTDEVKDMLLTAHRRGATNISKLARQHHICRATAVRWIKEK